MLNSHQLFDKASNWTCLKASLNTSWLCFADATSFHGLKYLASERTYYQKFVWLICMLVSGACLVVLAYYLYFHYMAAPTKTIVRSQHYPSVLIPFPAVTVCPSNKILRQKVERFLRPLLRYYEQATNDSCDENAILRAIGKVNSPLEYDVAKDTDMEQLDKILAFGGFGVAGFMARMSPDCEDWFLKCVWNSEEIPCKQILRRILTAEGYCCSFNYEGVKQERFTSVYATDFNLFSGLSIVLPRNFFDLTATKNNIRVLIHDPLTFPENIKTDFLVAQSKETAIAMRIVYSLADYHLRELSPSTRDCLFRDEYRLNYFSAYTYENCLTECQLKRYYKLCGCIPHYLPVRNWKVCKPTEISCIVHYSTQVLVNESGNETSGCICRKECDMFLIKTSLSEWNFHPMNESRVQLYAGLSGNSTIIHTYFGQSHNHLYNKVLSIRGLNFTSNIGGLVALFLGCSFISFLELIFYLTYRLFRIWRQIRSDTKVIFPTKFYLEYARRN